MAVEDRDSVGSHQSGSYFGLNRIIAMRFQRSVHLVEISVKDYICSS